MEWWDLHLHLGRSRDGASLTIDEIRKIMDECGISRAALFAIDEKDCGPSYETSNERVLKAVSGDARFMMFVRLNPREKKRASLELKRCRRAGARGVKLHPRSEKFAPREAEDLINEIEKEKLPVILHTSHEPNCRPLEWEPIFKRHSRVPFVLAHGGKDAFQEAVAVASRCPNLWLETSTLSFWRTKSILKGVGASRVVFGSDLPYSHPAVERVKFDLLLDSAERQKVYWENAKRMLGE